MLKRLLLIVVAAAATLSGQTMSRRATNLAALLAYPAFYHGRPVVLIGNVTTDQNGRARVADDNGSVRLVLKSSAPDGLDEIRGEFWDLSRMKADDPRLSTVDLRGTFGLDPDAPWPKAGEVTAIVVTTVTPASP